MRCAASDASSPSETDAIIAWRSVFCARAGVAANAYGSTAGTGAAGVGGAGSIGRANRIVSFEIGVRFLTRRAFD